jgi:pimeloyl-ACP methyl ester carboxylesterase
VRILLLHAFPLDPSMWESQRALLAEHEVVAPSLYGRGNSMDAWAESLLGELEGPFDVAVGASMGGGCALALERRSPGFLRAIVLVGAHAGPDPPERRAAREQQIAELRAQGDEEKAQVVEALRDRPDDRAVVRSFPGPLLVVVGDADEMISLETARALAESAPRGRLVVVPGAGHYVSLDRPQELNRALLAFLAEVGRA